MLKILIVYCGEKKNAIKRDSGRNEVFFIKINVLAFVTLLKRKGLMVFTRSTEVHETTICIVAS